MLGDAGNAPATLVLGLISAFCALAVLSIIPFAYLFPVLAVPSLIILEYPLVEVKVEEASLVHVAVDVVLTKTCRSPVVCPSNPPST